LASLAESISLEDAALVRRIQKGDRSAFEGLVIKYQDRVYNLCLRMVGHAENARDLTQETFIKALDAVDRFEHKSSFYTWLFRIAVNLSISFRRKHGRVKVHSLSGDGDSGDPDARLCAGNGALPLGGGGHNDDALQPPEVLKRRETRQAVMRALEQLDEEHRAVLVLRDVESMDYQAISNILELPMGTVRSRLHRARLALKELLKPVIHRAG